MEKLQWFVKKQTCQRTEEFTKSKQVTTMARNNNESKGQYK